MEKQKRWTKTAALWTFIQGKGRAANGDWPIGAAGCRREQQIQGDVPDPPPPPRGCLRAVHAVAHCQRQTAGTLPPPGTPAQVLLQITDPGTWIVPKLQGSEPAVQAAMEALGFPPHPVTAYVPRILTSSTDGTGTTACDCGYHSLASRLPNSETEFGPPAGTAADAARTDPVLVSLSLAAAVLTATRPLTAAVTLRQADCCAFAMLVTVEWHLQAPDGTHILPRLTAAGAARVAFGRRLAVAARSLAADAGAYTVRVTVRHSATGSVLGIGLQTFRVVDPPPPGAMTVVPSSGMR